MSETLDFQSWRCCHDAKLFCPPEGCPVAYGCARDKGWRPGMPSPPECQGLPALENLRSQHARKHMSRDEARAHWQSSGLRYAEIARKEVLERLRLAIDAKMRAAGLMNGTLRMEHYIHMSGGYWCGLMCRAHYFRNREAVTFNSETGFVGFAGWSDEENVQPILAGFVQWCDAEVAARSTCPVS